MKKAAKNLMVIGALSSLVGVVGYKSVNVPTPEGAVKQLQKAAGSKKLFYAYQPSKLGKKNMTLSVPEFDDVTLNAETGVVSFSATDEEVKEFKGKPKVMSEDWVIVEERVYSTRFSCATQPGPAPMPSPNPTMPLPTPVPGEWPTYVDRVDWGVTKTKANEALKVFRGSTVTVCVIDSGVDYNHPDLKGAIVSGGRSFVSGTTSAQDDNGHGSHVAGIIASRYDNSGMGGASQARIRPVKGLDRDGSGMSSWLMNAIIYSADSGCQVISNSWGSPAQYGPDQGITSAVQYAVGKGAILAFAAGNDSGRVGWPAAHAPSSPLIYAVSSSDVWDRISYFSSRGPEISVMAPGSDIESVRLGGGYVMMSGTSMATPYVAAALAMMIESGSGSLGYDNVGLSTNEQGRGRVNFLKTIGR